MLAKARGRLNTGGVLPKTKTKRRRKRERLAKGNVALCIARRSLAVVRQLLSTTG
jgi:hypothetical protein